MKLKTSNDVQLLLLGVCIGSAVSAYRTKLSSLDSIGRLREAVALRTDLLNWIVQEGIHLDKGHFHILLEEKSKFINIVNE